MSNSRPVHWQFLVLALAACVSAAAAAQTRPKRTDIGAAPIGILWVGNSFFYYNNSMHNHVSNLARAADPKSAPRATSVTISGSGIDWHDMESYFRPDGIGKYSFVGDNEIVFNKPGKQFDAVIMMDCEYTTAGNANGALVIPAGLAFAAAIAKRPEIELYQSDKRHPSLLGTYLAACTTYAAIFKRSPVGNPYTAGINAELANYLQSIAWDTVQDYYSGR